MYLVTTERNTNKPYNIITLQGRITAFHATTLREQFASFIAKGNRHFILDLSQVEFLDSAGLAALVNLLKQAQREGGDATMILPKAEAAQRILKLTRFDRVFPVASTVEAALQA